MESLPVKGDCVVYIAPLSRFIETDAQGGRFIPEGLELLVLDVGILIYRVE